MDLTPFQFTFSSTAVPPTSGPTLLMPTQSTFGSVDDGAGRGPRAEAQARYRAKNRAEEQAKARERMRALRLARRPRQQGVERPVEASAELRSSEIFALYCRHVSHHTQDIHGSRLDAEFMAGWHRLMERGEPFDREDAVFAIRYGRRGGRAGSPDEAEIGRQLDDLRLSAAIMVFDEGNEEAAAAYGKVCAAGPGELDEDDLEFMFRHVVPAPDLEQLRGCSCNADRMAF
ncbi:hypothetical protein B0H15DRAFT_807899 [Mycena belliarum]|uniref:Uncharacterized protein n=1 Tax=Mycena belliarum TaxID=1033014 RepID=A0AAD6TMC0_9AGAR|nr:hypothetical protein B0H15DRAFT_807899 [Mycena belliae]